MIDDFILYLVLWLFVYVYYFKIYFGHLLLYDYYMFFCSVNHRKQHLLSRRIVARRVCSTRTTRGWNRNEPKRKRSDRGAGDATRYIDQHGDWTNNWTNKQRVANWVSWVSVRKSTLSCVSSTDHPRMAMESPQVSVWWRNFWLPGSTQIARRSSRPWPAAKAVLTVCWMVFDCGYKISSSLYQDYIYINGSRYEKII